MAPAQSNLIRPLSAVAHYQSGIQDIITDLTVARQDDDSSVALNSPPTAQLVDRLTALLTHASEILTRPATTFFDLPPELRNRIYDILVRDIAANMPNTPVYGSNHRYCFRTNSWTFARWDARAGLVSPLVQVNKQVRTEFLPRLHRIIELSILTTSNHTTKGWLAIFGTSRCVLSRSFLFTTRGEEVRVELKGTPAAHWLTIPSPYRRATYAPAVNTGSQLARVKISSPQDLIHKRGSMHDFEQQLQDLVEGLVVERDGCVCLTRKGVKAICKYLRKQKTTT